MHPNIGNLNRLESLESMLIENYGIQKGTIFTHQYKEGVHLQDIINDMTLSDRLFLASDIVHAIYFYASQPLRFTNLSYSNILVMPVETDDERQYFSILDDVSTLCQHEIVDKFEDSMLFATATFIDQLIFYNESTVNNPILSTLRKYLDYVFEQRTHTLSKLGYLLTYTIVALKKHMYRNIQHCMDD